MTKIFDTVNRSHVFTLKDGKTLRVFAKNGADVDEKSISDEIRNAEKIGLIRIGQSNVLPDKQHPNVKLPGGKIKKEGEE